MVFAEIAVSCATYPGLRERTVLQIDQFVDAQMGKKFKMTRVHKKWLRKLKTNASIKGRLGRKTKRGGQEGGEEDVSD